MAGGDDRGDLPQDGRVSAVVEVGDGFVRAVDGQGVLDQVVGSDREEIDLLGQMVGDHHGGGHLDHGADGQVASDGHAFGDQLVGHFVEQCAGPVGTPTRLEISGNRTRTSPSELTLRMARSWVRKRSGRRKESRMLRRPSDGLRHSLDGLVVADEPIGAQVEGADGDGAIRHRLDDVARRRSYCSSSEGARSAPR